MEMRNVLGCCLGIHIHEDLEMQRDQKPSLDLNESRSANHCFPGSSLFSVPPAAYLQEVCATAVYSN